MSFGLASEENFTKIFAQFVDELLLYKKNDEILGLIGITKLPYRSSHVAYIHKLAINPNSQNKGIGSKIFNQVISDLKKDGISRIELKVESDNHNAIKFYKKIGFQIEGTLKNYFNREGQMIDEHLMAIII